MVLTDVTDPNGPYYTDTLTNTVVFDRKMLANANRDEILNALGHEFGHYSKEDNKTGTQAIANYSGEKLEDRTKGMVSKEATEDTLAAIRNNPNVITGEEGKKLAESIPMDRREYESYISERSVNNPLLKGFAHTSIPMFPNIQSDFFEEEGVPKEEYKYLGKPIKLKNGKYGWILAAFNGEISKGEKAGKLVVRVNDPLDVVGFMSAMDTNNKSNIGYIVKQLTPSIGDDTKPIKKMLGIFRSYDVKGNYWDYNALTKNCNAVSFSVARKAELIEKDSIYYRSLPKSRGEGLVTEKAVITKRISPGKTTDINFNGPLYRRYYIIPYKERLDFIKNREYYNKTFKENGRKR